MNKYVGIPYVRNGRDYNGLDCYGLVWLVEKEVFNKDIPVLGLLEDRNSCSLIKANLPLVNATKVDTPSNGDIVLFFYHGNPTHVGIYYNNGVLHAMLNIGVVYEALNSRNLRKFSSKEYYRV